jgi:hypothetical protein
VNYPVVIVNDKLLSNLNDIITRPSSRSVTGDLFGPDIKSL